MFIYCDLKKILFAITIVGHSLYWAMDCREFLWGIQLPITWNQNDRNLNYNDKEEDDDEVIGKKNDEEVLPGGRIITPSNYRPLSSTQACVITNPTLLYYTAVFDLWFMID